VWNCGRESGKFCLNADFHITFKDLLHAVKLRHGTDGFASPPKEGFLALKIRRLKLIVFGCDNASSSDDVESSDQYRTEIGRGLI